MRLWLAAWAAMGMAAAGCGGGNTPNGGVAPKITSTPPATATVGVPFNYTLTVEGMTPIAFAVVRGPDGMSIHPTSGVVSWTPSQEGTESIELSASNLAGSDTQAFDVVVEGLTAPVFTTEPPTEGAVATEYAYDPMVVAVGEVSWSAPTAPQGLSIDPETGAVRWIPSGSQVGENEVVIRATDDSVLRSTDQGFTITVVDTGGPAFITSTPPDRVYAGETWTYDATASGAPTIVWSVVDPASGTPAVGVSIEDDPPEGPAVTLSWDTMGVSPGEYSVAIQADNGLAEENIQEFTVTVDPRPPVPEIDLVTAPPPATMFVGTTYDYDVNLVPGTESEGVLFSLVGATVPEGLAITINSNTGEVSFTASESNGEIQYAYSVRAENVLGDGDEETITVDAVYPPATPVLSVSPASSFELEVGESFPGASAMATGNPAPTLSISGTLPDFLDFDPLTGLLSASSSKPTPENSDIGDHSFDIVATNTEGTDSETIQVAVVAAPPRVDSITPAAGRRQSDVPVIVRDAGFVSAASPTIVLRSGGVSESLATSFIDENTLSAVVPIDLARPSGVYDVVVDQGSTTTLAKRFTVTEGDGSTLSGSIGADLSLSAIASPHVVIGDVRVEDGATLTLEPGAVVMFAGNSNLRVDVGAATAGALVADGGEPGVGDQVVFTRFQEVGGAPPSGHYRGLRFGANNISATTQLRNVVVEFGGRRNTATSHGAIEVLSGSAPDIRDSIIRESLNYGLYAAAGAGSDATTWFDENQLTANGRAPISIGSDDVSTLGPSLELLGNGEDRVFVRGTNVTRATADWTNYGVPFYLSSGLVVRGGSSMSLEEGTEMRFAPNTRLRVSTGGGSGEDGTFVASGTPEAPIRMLADAAPWNGVHFDDNAQSGSVLRNVRVEGFSGSVNGGLRIDSGAAPPMVESCLVQSSEVGSVAVYTAGGAAVSSFENNVLDADALSLNAALPAFSELLQTSNTYEAPVRVRAGATNGAEMVWTKPLSSDSSAQPIRVANSLTLTEGSLTIAPGNRIEMPLNGQLTATESQLLVDGTVDEPVVIEPASGVAYWHRLRLRGAGAAGVSRVTHAVLRNAGSDPALGVSTQRAAVVVEARNGVPATPAIRNTLVEDSNGYGMVFNDTTHCGGMCEGNTVSGARFSALRMHANFVGRFGTGNALADNNTSATLGHEGVWVVGDQMNESSTWPAGDVPYIVQGNIELRQSYPLDPVPVWSIEPGAELRFAEDRRIRVGDGNDGVLDARGTASDPITFTTIDELTPAFWRGIEFSQGSDGSALDYVVVSYGGRSDNTGNVNFRMGSVVTIGVATFSHSEDYAAVIYTGSAPMFMGPASDRVYELNGQESVPGVGDPAFDCVRDVAAGTCEPL
jgi:hypothetical protein